MLVCSFGSCLTYGQRREGGSKSDGGRHMWVNTSSNGTDVIGGPSNGSLGTMESDEGSGEA